MEFEVYRFRSEGRLKPRHVFWAQMVRGALHVDERRDGELSRVVRVATIRASTGAREHLMLPLFDAVLLSARADLWTMTGWERIADTVTEHGRACLQSWYMVPAAAADLSREETARSRAAYEAVHPLGTEGGDVQHARRRR